MKPTAKRHLDVLRAAITVVRNDQAERHGIKLERPNIHRIKEELDPPRAVPLPVLIEISHTGPEYLAKAIGLTLIINFRQYEVLSIGPEHVDDVIKGIAIPKDWTKNGKGELIPAGSDEAWEYIKQLRREALEVGSPTLIFRRFKGGRVAPLKSFKKTWSSELERILKDTELKGKHYTWHNTKATFMSIAVKTTRNPQTLKKRGRHAQLATTLRYLEMDDQHIAESAQKGSQILAAAGLDFSGVKRLRVVESGKKGKKVPTRSPHTAARVGIAAETH